MNTKYNKMSPKERIYMDNYATKFVCETDQKYRWTPDMEYIATKVAELFAELLDERKENESIQ